MTQTNINIDYCGIRNLLLALLDNGFTEAEIKKIEADAAAYAVKVQAEAEAAAKEILSTCS